MHGSITSWENLLNKFYNNFFPMSKVNECRKEISSFTQEEDDKFSESWERFQEMLIKCPPHGYEKWRLVQFFYQGLTQSNRSMIESMNGGAFLSLTGKEAYRTLDQLSDNSQQWDFSSCRDKSARIQKKGGIYEVKEDIELKMKTDALTKKVDALVIGKSINAVNPFHVGCCSICAPMHLAQACTSLLTFVESPMEQVNAFNDFRKQADGPFSETYNPGWRNHPNFSCKQNQPLNQGGAPHQAHNQYPPGFHQPVHHQGCPAQPSPAYQAPNQAPTYSSQSTLEDTLKAFMQLTSQSINAVKNATMVNTQAISKIETQIGQIASLLGEREKGKLPSQPVPNPKLQVHGGSSSNAVHGQEHVQAVVTLSSGRQVDNKVVLPEENPAAQDGQGSGSTEEKDMEPSTATPTIEIPPRSFVPKAPYPNRLLAPKKGGKFEDILEVFKQVQINIPFLDAIQQVPSYASS